VKSLPEIIAEFCNTSHVPMAEAVFGKPGIDAIFEIMDTAKLLYKHVEPERIAGTVVIFKTIPAQESIPSTSQSERPADYVSLANLTIIDLALEIGSDGRAYQRTLDVTQLDTLAANSVIYRSQGGQEEFLAGVERKPVVRMDTAARSQFSIPTFSNLREALQHYASENIRESTCKLFSQAWQDDNRLFFKAKPEAKMRDSLTQFLRNRLGGDHDVWPEQIVDESHPVDIRVQPKFTNNRLMLIEIKWLGYSVADDGHITARHKEPRAQEGATQLAQYLDDQLRTAPSHIVQGYYVIIDGRRENLREGVTSISRSDGLHYETKDITFSIAPHKTRRDFDQPYRMFARPVCCD
jgi:hypothetical protein